MATKVVSPPTSDPRQTRAKSSRRKILKFLMEGSLAGVWLSLVYPLVR